MLLKLRHLFFDVVMSRDLGLSHHRDDNSLTSAAMMDLFGAQLRFHHEAHEGHEEQTTGLEKRPDFNMIFFSFVLFVSFVVVYSVSNAEFRRIKYQQRETLH